MCLFNRRHIRFFIIYSAYQKNCGKTEFGNLLHYSNTHYYDHLGGE